MCRKSHRTTGKLAVRSYYNELLTLTSIRLYHYLDVCDKILHGLLLEIPKIKKLIRLSESELSELKY